MYYIDGKFIEGRPRYMPWTKISVRRMLTSVALRAYCPQLTTRGPPPYCRCGDPEAASRLEATVRKT